MHITDQNVATRQCDDRLTCKKGREASRGSHEDILPSRTLQERTGRDVRILVFGHLGMGNIGDEAMLSPILDVLAKEYPGASLSVVAGPLRNRHLAAPKGCHLRWVDRRMPALLAAIMRCDIFVVAGGTHLCSFAENQRHTRGIIRHMLIYLFARLCQVRVLLLGVGIGPFETAFGWFLARAAIRCADFISVRDVRSQLVLEKLGYPSARTAICCEPANLLHLPPRRTAGMHLGLSLLQYHTLYGRSSASDATLVEQYQELLCQWFSVHPDGKASIVCFYSASSPSDDVELSRRITAGFNEGRVQVVDPQGQLDTCLESMRELTHMVTMRYHAQVLAWHAGIPQVVIAYHDKNRGFAETVGMDDGSILGIDEFLKGEGAARFEAFFRCQIGRRGNAGGEAA